jgi:hypothetical protein
LNLPSEAMDLVETFGPMSSMHAAMDRLGVGMPCGLIARLEGKSVADVLAAIAVAQARFPVLQKRITWIGSRPVLMPVDPAFRGQTHTPTNLPLDFKTDECSPLWRYQVTQDGADVWLNAVWAHAAADGASMLWFLKSIVATITDRPVPGIQVRTRHRSARRPFAPWLLRFLLEQHLRYVRPTEEASHPVNVVWLTLPVEQSNALHEKALAECGSFAAWLAAAVALAYCEQHEVSSGRVLLNLPLLRDDLQRVNGFGFGIGSLLMPAKIPVRGAMPPVARHLAKRLKDMIDQSWDENFDRFLGDNPKRHLRFAAHGAQGRSAPIISVSWKGIHCDLGSEDGVRDVCCFAVSPAAHLSAHIDSNGLSLSLASRQSDAAREGFLRRVAAHLGYRSIGRVHDARRLSLSSHSSSAFPASEDCPYGASKLTLR